MTNDELKFIIAKEYNIKPQNVEIQYSSKKQKFPNEIKRSGKILAHIIDNEEGEMMEIANKTFKIHTPSEGIDITGL